MDLALNNIQRVICHKTQLKNEAHLKIYKPHSKRIASQNTFAAARKIPFLIKLEKYKFFFLVV